MKNINKFILILFLSSSFFTRTYAQDEDKVPYITGVTIEIPITVGDFRQSHKFGYGFGYFYERGLSEKVAATISASYVRFHGGTVEFDNYPGVYQDYQGVYQIPFQIGGKYYFYAVHYGLYLKAELGLHLYKSYDIQEIPTTDFLEAKTGSGPGFAFSFGVVDMGNLDLNFRYQVVSVEGRNLSYISIKCGYAFAAY